MTRAETLADWVLSHEIDGDDVYSDHPSDRGGKTMFGITEAVARRHGCEVSEITREKARRILVEDYWSFDWIESDVVARKLFDIAVNGGPRSAAIILQRAIGTVASPIDVDGDVGPGTRQATRSLIKTQIGAEKLVAAICYQQASRYIEIVRANPTQKAFIGGWLIRSMRA